jgi:hypothetical protein
VTGHAVEEEVLAHAVVGLLLEAQGAAVLHELEELRGVSSAEVLKTRLDLLLLNVVVFLVLGAAWESLPGQLTLDKVQEHVTDGLQVVSSGLLDTLVGGDGSVSGSSSQVLALFAGDVLALTVFVALSEAEINNVDAISGGVGAANQEVVGLDISMNDSLFMDLLNAANHLGANHADCLEVELALAGLEQVLEGGSEEVHDHHVELLIWGRSVRSDVVQTRHTG